MRREYKHKPVNQIPHRHISRATKMTRIARQNRGDSATQERITASADDLDESRHHFPGGPGRSSTLAPWHRRRARADPLSTFPVIKIEHSTRENRYRPTC